MKTFKFPGTGEISEQRRTFEDRGLIRLDGLLPSEVVAPARERVFEVLERASVWREGAWCGPIPVDSALASRLRQSLKQSVKRSAEFASLQTQALLEAVDQLADGQPVSSMDSPVQLLMTPPGATRWTVPHKVWHLDVPRLGDIGLPGVQMFAFLDAVEPGGGGTLVAAGSHRLLNDRGRIRSRDVKKRLKREPYFRDLFSPGEDRHRLLEEPGHIGDVELQVVELTGAPGDVYLVDMRMLHTLAPNTCVKPRLMVTQRFFLQCVVNQLTAPS